MSTNFDAGWSGWIFTFFTAYFFSWVRKFSANVYPIPPGVIRGNSSDEYRVYRWRNIVVSYIHAMIAACWSAVCSALYGQRMRQDYVEFVNWPTYLLCCLTTGYFLYDGIDIVAAGRAKEKWDILLHHMAILISASYVVTYAECAGYQAFGAIMEVNTVFLHRRQLHLLAGVDRNDPSFQVNSCINLVTFVLFRCFPLAYMTTGIFYDGHRVPIWYLSFYSTCMALLNVINVVLLYRLVRADFLKNHSNGHNSNNHDDSIDCCEGLDVGDPNEMNHSLDKKRLFSYQISY